MVLTEEQPMTNASRTEGAEGLIISAEFQLACCPLQGRLWRLDTEGAPGRELATWYINKASGQCMISPIWIAGLGRRGSHRVIFRMIVGRWPAPGWI